MKWSGSADDLREVFTALLRTATMPTVALALRRFDAAYGRGSDEDKLIDHWVALEALFLHDRHDELSYLGPLRIARYLEQQLDARRSVFELLRESYRTRSTVVHGSTTKNVGQTASGTEDILRRALRKMLVAGEAPSPADFQNLLLG
jgi:hypothetical protein